MEADHATNITCKVWTLKVVGLSRPQLQDLVLNAHDGKGKLEQTPNPSGSKLAWSD